MSEPIKVCLVVRAMMPAKHPQAYATLIGKLERNAGFGGFTAVPCRCVPQCKSHVTQEELDAFTTKIFTEHAELATMLFAMTKPQTPMTRRDRRFDDRKSRALNPREKRKRR